MFFLYLVHNKKKNLSHGCRNHYVCASLVRQFAEDKSRFVWRRVAFRDTVNRVPECTISNVILCDEPWAHYICSKGTTLSDGTQCIERVGVRQECLKWFHLGYVPYNVYSYYNNDLGEDAFHISNKDVVDFFLARLMYQHSDLHTRGILQDHCLATHYNTVDEFQDGNDKFRFDILYKSMTQVRYNLVNILAYDDVGCLYSLQIAPYQWVYLKHERVMYHMAYPIVKFHVRDDYRFQGDGPLPCNVWWVQPLGTNTSDDEDPVVTRLCQECLHVTSWSVDDVVFRLETTSDALKRHKEVYTENAKGQIIYWMFHVNACTKRVGKNTMLACTVRLPMVWGGLLFHFRMS